MTNRPILDIELPRRTVLVALAAAPFVLTGCSGDSDSDTTADVPAGEVGGTLHYWITGLDSIDDKTVDEYTQIYIEPFEKLYPDVTVDAEPQNDEGLTQKLQTAL